MATPIAALHDFEEGEQFYHQLLEGLQAPVYACDILGHLKLYNQAAVDLWGIEPQIGKTKWCGSWKIYRSDGSRISLDECPMAVAIKEGKIIESEEIIIERPDRVRINVLAHPKLIKDSVGTVVGAINMLLDITALRATEQKLRESTMLQFQGEELFKTDILEIKSYGAQLEKKVEERTRELERANRELVFQNGEKEKRAAELAIANTELAFQNGEKERCAVQLTAANRELALQIKRAAELIIANGELVFQNGEKGKRATELAATNEELAFQISEKGKRAAELIIANGELVFQNKEKEKRAAELVIANQELVFQNSEKERRAAELIIANEELAFQNIEKGKRAAELIIANEELAFQSREKEKREAELIIANKELVFQNGEKEKRAAELIIINTELKAFSYISSHDLQEPLRKIQTLSRRILETENQNLSEKGKEYFNRMQSAASRMRLLIDDLLEFSSLSIVERKFENTDLNKIIDEVKNELKEIIEEKHVTIEAEDLCRVEIIPFQFRQVMHNLIGNSLKFSKPGLPPHIVIKSRIATGAELNEEKLIPSLSYCHISVSDNGIGFDAEHKDNIFNVFQRLHGADEYTGSGIGLAIVKKVVDNHNGAISATGVVNEGATFNIYLPVSQE